MPFQYWSNECVITPNRAKYCSTSTSLTDDQFFRQAERIERNFRPAFREFRRSSKFGVGIDDMSVRLARAHV